MSTRAQQAQLLDDVTFKLQVKGALLAAAANILQEAPTTPNHDNRIKWANAIYVNPQQQMQFFLPGMLTNPTIAASAGGAGGPSGTPVSDNDVDFVVASLFDKYATQYAAQQNFGASLQLGQTP
jgi:hypothetical protein